MPNADTPDKPRSNLANRLLASLVVIPALVFIFWADHRVNGGNSWVFLGLCIALGLRASWEACDLLHTRSFKTNRLLVMGLTVFVVASAWYAPVTTDEPDALTCAAALGPTGLAFAVSVIVLLLAGAARYTAPGHSMETLGAELLAVAYVGLLLAVAAQLRWVAGVEAGYLVIGSMIIPTKCGDIGAYTFGRLFGKRKMAPVLSPGKTWAGAVGAVVFASLAAWLWLRFMTRVFEAGWELPAWYLSLIYGAALGVAGLLGDLCESLIKRDVQRKDAAPLIPGFGGALDLLDSPLFAGTAAYLLWSLLPLATWR